jgi:PAS domain S-box-containing protein
VGWSIQLKMMAGFSSALGVLVAIATLSYFSTRQALTDRNSISQAYQVMAEIQTIRSLIADAETGQRGYLITGDESFLTPYLGASGRALDRLARLERLVVENPIQRRKLAELRPLVIERFDLMSRGVRLRDEEGYETTQIAVSKGRGRTLMEQIRRILAEMSAEEGWELNRGVEASSRSVRHAKLAYTLLILLDVVLLGSVFHLIRHDIAERNRAEQRLHQSRERFEVAVRGSRDGLWDWDLATNEVYFSPRWKEQLGYAEHEIGSHYEEWESRVHPEDRERALATIRKYMDEGAEHGELEHRLQHRDGTYRWVLSRAIILRDEQGKPYRLAGSTRDITPRKQSERLLLEQNRRLEESALSERQAHEELKLAQSRLVQSEKLVSLGQMVAGVAHEINNPLGFVINNIAVLQRDIGEMRELLSLYIGANDLLARERPDLHAEIKALSDRVDMTYTIGNIAGLIDRSREGLRRIHQIVKDLRAFARLDEGEIKEADLNPGIESAATIIRGNARNKQVQFELDLDCLPAVTCNPAKINQVVMNLLSNAVDACPEGGKVTVRSRAEASGIRIEVCDTGPGIDPRIRDRIFDPFFTTKPVGQGTGLGLSISYGIVQDHGGSIEVDSGPGRGTRMTVHLPFHSPRPSPPTPVARLLTSDGD